MDGSLASMFMDGRVGASPGCWTKSGESKEEVHQVLMWASMEVESLRAAAQAEVKLQEARLWRLEQLLENTRKERDEAREECLKLQLRLHTPLQQWSFPRDPQTSSTMADLQALLALEPKVLGVQGSPEFSMDGLEHDESLDLEELQRQEFSMDGLDEGLGLGLGLQEPQAFGARWEATNHTIDDKQTMPLQIALPVHLPEPPESDPQIMLSSLPQKGKLLQAVMQAGPLLQTLLLAGPLPQWRHPPPVLHSLDIPTVPSRVLPPHILPSSSPPTSELSNPAPLVNPPAPNLSNPAYVRAGIAASIANNSAANPCSRSRKLRKLNSAGLNDVQMMM